jgi:multicomponent Na+:H+ antiporter subunit E
MRKRLAEFVVIFSMWVLLTWSINIQDIFAGLVVAFFVTILTRRLFPDDFLKLLNPKRFLFGAFYIPYLFYYILLANLDVAYRVLNPFLPIKPGIVKVKTSLKNDFAKTILANSITLTPGTLTVEVDGDYFYVHWINVSSDDPDIQRELILGRFERMLRRIFE